LEDLLEIAWTAVIEHVMSTLFRDQLAARVGSARADDSQPPGARDLRGRNTDPPLAP
jgi:hypothetical protein